MNRLQKENIRKCNEAQKGKSPEEIDELDKQDLLNEKIEKLARELHLEKFPEEYDYMSDDAADYNNRIHRNTNPMHQSYIDEVNQRRISSGFLPLAENGMPVNQETIEYCLHEAREDILKT